MLFQSFPFPPVCVCVCKSLKNVKFGVWANGGDWVWPAHLLVSGQPALPQSTAASYKISLKKTTSIPVCVVKCLVTSFKREWAQPVKVWKTSMAFLYQLRLICVYSHVYKLRISAQVYHSVYRLSVNLMQIESFFFGNCCIRVNGFLKTWSGLAWSFTDEVQHVGETGFDFLSEALWK